MPLSNRHTRREAGPQSIGVSLRQPWLPKELTSCRIAMMSYAPACAC